MIFIGHLLLLDVTVLCRISKMDARVEAISFTDTHKTPSITRHTNFHTVFDTCSWVFSQI